MKISAFYTDTDLENEGVWVDCGQGLQLKIARVGNVAYRKEMAKHSKKTKTNLPEEVADQIVVEVMSKTILLDWEGLEDEDGELIPYSREEAKKVLQVRDFRDLVWEIANERQTFVLEEEEAVTGN